MIYCHEDQATPVLIHIGTYQIDKDSVVYALADIPRCREWRGLSLGGGGWRQDATVWLEKLVEEFAGTQAVDEELRRGVEGATSGGSR
jgi:hypothetical protein